MPSERVRKAIILLHELAKIGIKRMQYRIANTIHAKDEQNGRTAQIVVITLLLDIDFWGFVLLFL